jgi:micrococcal nuclease
VVELDGEELKLRYIGVDTPESDEPFGPTASNFNATLLGQGDLILVSDQSEVDPFGRMLAYVLAGDRFINYELVRAGWAISKAYPPDTACLAVFDGAQALAQADGLGLWALSPTPALRSGDISLTPVANCDPSYPEVCIPPSPPDLDCADINFRNFKVLPPDPHHFDMNQDGLGCESNN